MGKFSVSFSLTENKNHENPSVYHKLPCGNNIKIDNFGFRVRVSIPCFLTDNIFYTFDGRTLRITNSIESIGGTKKPNPQNNQTLNQHGFLPFSKTQFDGVFVFCSYLDYNFSLKGTQVSINHPSSLFGCSTSLTECVELFDHVVRSAVEGASGERLIIPLSGGIDSRLLANLCGRYYNGNIDAFSLGVSSCGDILIARKVIKELGRKFNHKIFDLSQFSAEDLQANYLRAGYMVPLDRLLGHNLDRHYSGGVIFSGIYGDVVFGDDESTEESFKNYVASEGIVVDNDLDEKILNEYNKLPHEPKLFRIILRCQKLTKVSLHVLNNSFKIVSPYIDDKVVAAAVNLKEHNIYPKIVNRLMDNNIKTILHQSSLSVFTHPRWMRYLERRFNQITFSKISTPYYTKQYLKTIGVRPSEAPCPLF